MATSEPIAVLGTGCRFPGSSSSPSKLWDLLRDPRDISTKVPKDRFNIDAFYNPNGTHLGTTNVKGSYFLDTDDISRFDAPFFNISASEAGDIDPQQRLILETVYESLEAAGLSIQALQGSSTGVFSGVMNDDWGQMLALDHNAIPPYSATGVARTCLANRVSYFFNWHGPSFTIDTACSSSMVALHQAVYSLRAGESQQAVVTGANLIFSPNMYLTASNMQMLSPNGRSRMWDDKADGYARGEGVASIVLKRLSDAVANGDPIECIVRGTGTNQDGRTMGLTMPSSDAQTQLIKSTYASAGLDPINRRQDQCQFFEAHGTGTLAGDPQEASAIYRTFFASLPNGAIDDEERMYVGSIKTVIGHTEGTAGLAGIIKASLCIQNKTIVPNLHFDNVNPAIRPYITRLKVATSTVPWPELPPRTPRRVSVNSFGFGGANAHAIIESFEPEMYSSSILTNGLSLQTDPPSVLPFVFSATSERVLATLMEQYLKYLKNNSRVNPTDLAWSLLHRRTVLPNRLVLWAPTIAALQEKIQEALSQQRKNSPLSTAVSRLTTDSKKILGIFTGQGAQWPQMALDLITSSPEAAKWFNDLQKSLDQLPAMYRPDFSLIDELLAPASRSRVAEPIISQTLCTAVQIVQVNVLSALGISFSAVIGHSSGEIGAAYAAGVFSAWDAIRIAYLRGWVVSRSRDQAGAMLAAGLSPEEAAEICAQPEYKDRATVAACNSPSSVTLSGDRDAIHELEEKLKKENKFVRLLRVNMAYHSHHMNAYSIPYLQALEVCNIRPATLKTTGTQWYSSVYSGEKVSNSLSFALAAEYWKDNMVSPVLFAQALTEATSGKNGLPDLIVEVGPHHALKGPAVQTLSNSSPSAANIPYIPLASRGFSSVETLATAIGSFWIYLGPMSVNSIAYVEIFGSTRTPKVVRGLPVYPFDRSQVHWFDSRWTKVLWNASHPPHPLLGSVSPDTTEGEWRWRNYLRRNEIDWLDGHQVQSQTIFPATGYIALAVEASKIVALDLQHSLQLVQVHDLNIEHAISFSDDDSRGIETLCSLDQIKTTNDNLSGVFSCFVNSNDNLKKCVSGRVTISWGEPRADILPEKPTAASRKSSTNGFTSIDINEFYAYLTKIGYGYDGPFKSMRSIERKVSRATGDLANQIDSPFIVHPALMDTGLQALFAALEEPGDGQLTTLHVPTSIKTATINPGALKGSSSQFNGHETLQFDSVISSFKPGGFSGDIDLYTNDGNMVIQFEGVQVSPLIPPTAALDRKLFSEVSWGPYLPNAHWEYMPPPDLWHSRVGLPDHVAFYYMKEVQAQLTEEDRQGQDWHRARIIAWIDHIIGLTRAGKHPICQKEWLSETEEDIQQVLQDLGGIDAVVLQRVGENLLAYLRDEITMLEVLRKDDALGQFYKGAVETLILNARLADIVNQLAFRFPRQKILEIGGGTGSATQAVLKRIGRSFHSYTFTDISAGFFEEAQTQFADHDDQFIYKVLDLEQEPEEQGFEEHSYDLIIAANVLHATKSLEKTMHRVRRLLKPGGRLIALEGVNLDVIRITFVICGFEGWWLGEQDGRPWGALVSASTWEDILRRTGFNGFETVTPMDDLKLSAYVVFVAQADDDRMRRLHEPLAYPAIATGNEVSRTPDLVLVGGATDKSSSLIMALRKTLSGHFGRIIHSPTLEFMGSSLHSWKSSHAPVVMTLSDIDEPCFQNLTQERMNTLKALVSRASKLLWVSVGSEVQQPHLSMSRGFLNSVRYEQPQCLFQHLNVVNPEDATPLLLVSTLMRLAQTDFPNDYELGTCVESTEPDLRFEDGIMKISRIQPAQGMNDRYNANRRKIQVPVDLKESVVQVDHHVGDATWTLSENKTAILRGKDDSSNTWVSVEYSTLQALKIPGAGYLHLIAGRDVQTDTYVLALADRHTSIISTPISWTWELPTNFDGAKILQATAAAILASSLLEVTLPGTTLLVNETDKIFQRAIQLQAAGRGVKPFFITNNAEAAQRTDSLYIHRWSSHQALAEKIPDNVSTTARFGSDPSGVFSRVEAFLQNSVPHVDLNVLSRPLAALFKNIEPYRVAATLQSVHGLASQIIGVSNPSIIDTISVEKVSELSSNDGQKLHVVDWLQTQQLAVTAQPATTQVHLSPNKTYLLIGLTSDLGQSVCQWFISRGARHVILTGRTPKISPAWIKDMAKLGARVAALPM